MNGIRGVPLLRAEKHEIPPAAPADGFTRHPDFGLGHSLKKRDHRAAVT